MNRLRTLAIVLSSILLSLAICANGQNAGQTGTQTITIQLANNSSATGRIVVPAKALIGAGAHYFTYCTSASGFSGIAEQSPDGNTSHFVPMSTVYGVPPATINGNPCAVVPMGGYFDHPAFNVLSVSGGTFSLWYSASTGPVPIFPTAASSSGAATPPVCDQAAGVNASGLVLAAPGNSGVSIHICSITVSFQAAPGGSGGFSLISGTGGGNCLGNEQTVWGFIFGTTSPLFYEHPVTLNLPAGSGLCLQPDINFPTFDAVILYAKY